MLAMKWVNDENKGELIIEFSLNDFDWIHYMATRDILYMTMDTFVDGAVKKNVRLLYRLVSVQSGQW